MNGECVHCQSWYCLRCYWENGYKADRPTLVMEDKHDVISKKDFGLNCEIDRNDMSIRPGSVTTGCTGFQIDSAIPGFTPRRIILRISIRTYDQIAHYYGDIDE